VKTTVARGQASISLVLLVGGIASAAVITIATVAIGAIASGYGADHTQRARGAAMAGIDDALLRITRNPGDSGSYTLTAGSSTVSVSITQNAPSAGFTTISSSAASGFRTISLAGVYSVDPVTGIPTPVSLTVQ
jgi:hypothetical protein